MKIQTTKIEIKNETINYEMISPDSPLMRFASEAIIRIQEGIDIEANLSLLEALGITLPVWEEKKNPCQSKVIVCYIQTDEGFIAGTDGINNQVPQCLRYIRGEFIDDYQPCRDHEGCFQPGHGEIMAVINYFLQQGIVDVDKLNQIFPNTVHSNGTLKFGVVSHNALLEFIEENHISLGDRDVYLYGQTICCEGCSRILKALGINTVFIAPETQQDQYGRRAEIHKINSTIEG